MKTIAELNGVDFLRQCNKIRYEVQDILKETNILKIRQKQPDYTGADTKEERLKRQEEQAKKNLNEMLDVLLEEKPEETIKLFNLLVIPEKGDKELTGMELTMIGLGIVSDKRVMDFLLSLIRLGQTATGDM